MTTDQLDPAQLLVPVGSTGLRVSGGQIQEEYAKALKGRRSIDTFTEMADSPLPGAFLLLLELLARQVEWRVKPAREQDPEAERWAAIVRGAMDDMDTPWRQVITEFLSAVIYGWSRAEIVWKIRRGPDQSDLALRSDFADGLWGWRDFSPRSQDSLDRWIFDDGGAVVAMIQRIIGGEGGEFEVPERKMIAVIPRPHKRSPEGRSFFRAAAQPWFYAKKLADLEALALDRDMVGTLVVELPTRIMRSDATAAETAVRQQWEDTAAKIRNGRLGAITIPAPEESGVKTGYGLRTLAGGGTFRVNPDTAIRRHESRELIPLLCEFMLLGLTSVGARAVADPKINLFNLGVGAVLDVVADAINARAVADMMRLNGVPEPMWPTIEHGPVDGPDVGELGAILGQLVGAGVVMPTEDLQRWVLGQIPGAPVPSTLPAAAEKDEDAEDDDDEEDMTPQFTAAELRDLMSASAVRATLGVGSVGLRRLIDEGKLAAYRINGRWRFDPKRVHELLAASAHQVDPAPSEGE